jgi:hypothetical protein
MRQGSILGRIAKEVSLSNYLDDTPLSAVVDKTLRAAIPIDVYDWFMKEICPPVLSGRQGRQLLSWLFKNIKKAEIDLNHIKLIRQARRESIIDIIKDNLPTPATMAHVTTEHLEAYQIEDCIKEELIPYLAGIIKRDEQTILVSIQWSLKAGAIGSDDLHWMLRYCKPVSEYIQLNLI